MNEDPINCWDELDFWKSIHWFKLHNFLDNEEADGKIILPHRDLRLRCFRETPYKDVKAVILGQDPYPVRSYANGLSFCLPPAIATRPKTFTNIIEEYCSDLGFPAPVCPDLASWAASGVLLFNSILSVEHRKPLSHEGKGWEQLTYEVMSRLSHEKERLVFILWGFRAWSWKPRIDGAKHLVITSTHPSMWSASRKSKYVDSFFKSRPFSRTNGYLKEHGVGPINWRLT